jgi:hypothetical protein
MHAIEDRVKTLELENEKLRKELSELRSNSKG